MLPRVVSATFILGMTLLSLSAVSAQDSAEVVFDDTRVHNYYLYFSDDNWYDSLRYHYYNTNEYYPGELYYGIEYYDSVGIKFKGFSSCRWYPGRKKPFRFSFNEYLENQTFHGLKKLNLNNNFNDPTMLREKLTLDLFRKHIDCMRCSYARLYINARYWGLYLCVEQVNKSFIEDRFGQGEDGNLFQGDPSGWLTWLGTDTNEYRLRYQLENNEEEDYWGDLIDFCYMLNHTPDSLFADSLQTHFDCLDFLQFLAMNTLFVDLDSYFHMGHNYFIYHQEDDGRFVHIPWDWNESFGRNIWGFHYAENLINIDIFHSRANRVLVHRIFQVPLFRDINKVYIEARLNTDFTPLMMNKQIDHFSSLIRRHVYDDTLKMYTDTQFEFNLEEDIVADPGGKYIFGLKRWVRDRCGIVFSQLNSYSDNFPLVINEFMARNQTTLPDPQGDFDDWIEIWNRGASAVNLEGMFLTDNYSHPRKWTCPDTMVGPNQYVLIWADKDTNDSGLHANFRLDGTEGEEIGLFGMEQGEFRLFNGVSFLPQKVDVSYGRIPDGAFHWSELVDPTPGCPNPQVPVIPIFRNEPAEAFPIPDIYPNPCNESVSIEFSIARRTRVALHLFNLQGRCVGTVIDEYIPSGFYHQVIGLSGLSSGLYFCQLSTDGGSSVRKIVLLK